MEKPVPLSDEDLAILAIEGPNVAGHTCKVIRLASPGVGFDDLFESIGSRLGSVPELRWKLGADRTAWMIDEDFLLDRHLVVHPGSNPVSASRIPAVAAELFGQKLDRDHPLWRIDFVTLDDGGAALVWRIHHALADGTTAMRFAREMIWTEAPDVRAKRKAVTIAHREAENVRRRANLVKVFEREFARSKMQSPFDGQIGAERSVAFASICLSDLHDAARSAASASLNDAVLSVVGGSLRHWMALHHENHLGGLRVKVPVSLHHGDDDSGNRDSFFSVPLALNQPDPVLRLEEIVRLTSLRKKDHDAEELDSLLDRLGHLSPRLRRYYSKFESNPRRFALNVSNVRGPPSAVTVLEAPVESLHSIAEIGERHALRIAVVSIDDQLCFGFCADPELVADLEVMAEGVELEAERLVATAGGSAG